MTIKDVSRDAGVSIKTVSRVLNKERYVGEETRRRVEEAVARLHFRPSIAARSLAGRRSYQIALICDNPSPFYVYEMQMGIRNRCVADGVRMIAQPYDRDSDALVEEIESLIDQTHPDGLILTPPATDYPGVLDLLERRRIRFVRIQPGTRLELSAATHIDNHAASAAMTAHLLGLGHRRIGFIAGDELYEVSGQRRAGYIAALAAAGLAADPALMRGGDYTFPAGVTATEALLALDSPPTAIFASNDAMAAGALAVAHRRGLRLPDDLSVAGFDDTSLATSLWPALTTIRQPMRALAYEAADLLLAAEETRERRQLPFELVVRDSTGPRRAA